MKKQTIGIIILCVLSISFSIYYFSYGQFIYKKQEPKQKADIKESQEKKIKDAKIKQDLTEKIKNLEGSDYCFSEKDYENGCLYLQDEIKNTDLSFLYKIYSLIGNQQESFIKQEEKIKWKEQIYSVEASISKQKIEEEYQKLYGKPERIDFELINNDNYKILYNPSDESFYLKKSKKEKPKQIRSYFYKYTNKENEYYIYTSVAFINLIGKNEYTNYEVYQEKEHINLKAEGIYNEIEHFIINEDNYKEYNKYKYTFQKTESGDYQFINIEKL